MDYYTKDAPEVSSTKPEFIQYLERKQQCLYDSITPYAPLRWLFTFALLIFYILRVVQTQGFHVVSYAMGIFLLNRLIGFLSPLIDPSTEADADPLLPTKSSEEFRPFLRQLSEFKFWNSCTLCILISVVCTFFWFLDIPVFWPILVLYFFMLFYWTMKRQISHMIKYRYLPFTYGKPRHQAKPNGSNLKL